MKNTLKLGLGAVALAAAAAMLWAQGDTPLEVGLFDYKNADSVARGVEIYVENCAACHGANLEGQGNWQSERSPQGLALAPPHDAMGHTWHHPDEQLFQIVKFGTAALVGGGYESDMIGYDGILTDQQILDVMAYIKSTWPDDIVGRHNEMNAAAAGQ